MLVGIVTREDLGIAGLQVLSPGRLDADEGIALRDTVCPIRGADKGLAHVFLGSRVCFHTGSHGKSDQEAMGMEMELWGLL